MWHHYERLYHGRVTSAVQWAHRNRRCDGMTYVTDLLVRGTQMLMIHGACTMHGSTLERNICPWRAWPVGRMGTSVRKRRFEDKWASYVSGEGLANRINLFLQIWHGPRLHNRLHKPHMTLKILTGITVEVRIGRNNGHLRSTGVSDNGAWLGGKLPRATER